MTSIINAPASTSSIVMNEDKRSGQLIIKAQLGNDIRKMMIHNEDLTLNGKKNIIFCFNKRKLNYL